MAEDSRVNTSDVLPPSYLQVRWARGGCAGVGGRGSMAHAPLGLQAERAGDGERADRAEGRPSMEITSDQ